ncbi:MAG: tRNA threonylcarbamoyladenosine biosynthesis protein RimN [Xanthomonadales bacterium]|nr:tRNA threonylcarbamoyladenosine biosynthesis protein RimN [Xanthomonadales bacterium]
MNEQVGARFRVRHAARLLADGGVIAHPADGVWGLAADAADPVAVGRILAMKQRDVSRGLIVIADNPAHLAPLVAAQADHAWQRAIAAWPAAETWLLPAAPDAPVWLTGGRETIALREPAHALTRALCHAFGGALVSTSANVTGRAPIRSTWAARARFGGAIDGVVAGVPDTPGIPSTIRDAETGEIIRGG